MLDVFEQKRLEMIKEQLLKREINAEAVIKSMTLVPRHLFVASSLVEQAYNDTPLPIGHKQTISQPYIVALMLQEAKLKPTDIVLDIGTGCGYAAAVLSNIVKTVYSIEFVPELALEAKNRLERLGYANITVLQGDGSIGLKDYAPFNAIIVAAGAPIVPQALKDQLAINGRLIIPFGNKTLQELIRVTRLDKDNYQKEKLGAVRFVPLIGQGGWPSN